MEQNQQPQPPVYGQPQGPQPQYQPQYQPRPQARPTLGFGEANKIFWKKSLDFTGRARRSEYWWGYLSVFIISLIWSIVACVIVAYMLKDASINLGDDDEIFRWFLPKYLLAFSPVMLLMVPVYAAQTRRLHDTGRSGWWIVVYLLCSLVYFAGSFYLLFNMFDIEDSLENMNWGFFLGLTLFYLVGVVLSIVIFVFTLLDSKPEENKYGPSPKYQ